MSTPNEIMRATAERIAALPASRAMRWHRLEGVVQQRLRSSLPATLAWSCLPFSLCQ
jgi:hypothetical protein